MPKTKSDERVEDAIIRRKAILTNLSDVERFTKEFNVDRDTGRLQVRQDLVDRIYDQFQKAQTVIEKWDGPDRLEMRLAERSTIEERFCEVKAFLLNNIPERLSSSTSAEPTAPTSTAMFHLRLPKIDLPRFDGDFSRWLSFRDTFKSMVHSNPDVPAVAKLQYLLQSLEGEAKKPFESVNVEADNYLITWDALMKRYDNQRYLKRQLFRAMYDIQPLRKESSKDLHTLTDDFDRHVKAMAKLGEPVGYWDTPLVNLLCYKLDPTTLRAWEEKTSDLRDITYQELIDFLYSRAMMLKTIVSEEQRNLQTIPARMTGSQPKKAFRLVANPVASDPKPDLPVCVVCSERHHLFRCRKFASFSPYNRRQVVTSHRLCWNCFNSGHLSRSCSSRHTCRFCNGKHHSLLHDAIKTTNFNSVPKPTSLLSNPPLPAPQRSTAPPDSDPQPSTSSQQVCMTVQATNSTVLLETVMLLVVDSTGKEIPARALLDSASMCSFMTKKLANTLDLRRSTVDIAVSGIGESSKQIKRQLTAKIRSTVTKYATKLDFLILKRPTVCLPTVRIDVAAWKIPDVDLADPHFFIPADIDLIVGGEVYHELHGGSKISLGNEMPTLVETVFGWAVSGSAPINSSVTPRLCHLTTIDRDLEQSIERFWELESLLPSQALSAEEIKCEEVFSATTTRDSSGRFVVRLPLTSDPLVRVGESRSIAERRFQSLERRLKRDPATREAYVCFMADYERLGHMIKLTDPVDDSVPHCYLPHHPVFKESSTSTKVRVVFDASCKTSTGYSINDMQLVGPTIQDDLLSIIMRFRTHPIALVADIEKMYRQIQLHLDDCKYQRILWRQGPEEPLATFELQTVTYGFASAPFLATRALQRLAEDEISRFPVAAPAFKNDFYVDDCLTGAEDVESAVQLRREASALAASAGLPLKKWASNVPEALRGIPREDLAVSEIHSLQDDQAVSTLGLVWETRSDVLRFRVQLPLPAPVLTKRKIMSYIAQIFDPLGLVGPIITVAKLFMQRLWGLRTENGESFEWDRPLPASYQADWKEFHSTLDTIATIQVPRYVSSANATSFQLHFFSDASEKAYGSCCYIRSECDGVVRVVLLTSKSKVAPLKSHHSIARLELCGAVLSVSLSEKVNRALKLPAEMFFWTDSSTVLQWLQSPPNRWKTFVANRVSKIQNSTDVDLWMHVRGESNPADVLSRGISPPELVNHPLWWTGSPWLQLPPSQWPRTELSACQTSSTSEMRVPVAALPAVVKDDEFADRIFGMYSSYQKLRRSIAHCMRYFRLLKAAARKTKMDPFQALTTADLHEADLTLCRLAQKQSFPEELATLASTGRLPSSSQLKYIRTKLDSDGVIRIRGVLANAIVPEATKHQIVLLAKHPLSKLLAKYYHGNLLHAGPQLMLATIRQKYWIIGGRNLVRRTFHECHKCFRCRPKMIQQSIADLPTSRVAPRRPFAVSGVDYCGPVYIKSLVRNRGPTKAYVCIFVCFTTRAVHIELVSDLSTPAFIAALRRFSARRNFPHEIHSDNGTAFRGANNELHRIYQMLKTEHGGRKNILDWCAESGVAWHFIPPRSPHFGGLWEAAVKSAKHHLLREIGHSNISYEDMTTLLAEVEMCLNSRPLIPMPTESDELEALTPGHFLVGESLRSPPEEDVATVPDNQLSHWKLTQKRFQRIWRRWYPEYLQQLQARATKHRRPSTVIQPNQMVIIQDDLLPPAQWPLGIITAVHPGKDGVVRVVTLRTAKRDVVSRCVNKLALLPVPEQPEPNPADEQPVGEPVTAVPENNQ
ncbi:uncharacterized protein LOC129753286 [Uranotaenia lowii]|uniref:uncharacterized protein LOC129753286 n=2 Tax=Uranotaenia lowii TaxID=190385 RepID=UPI0024784EAF|nr:uncharacterized protein LOC129753286 [Uranotaenia lowii]